MSSFSSTKQRGGGGGNLELESSKTNFLSIAFPTELFFQWLYSKPRLIILEFYLLSLLRCQIPLTFLSWNLIFFFPSFHSGPHCWTPLWQLNLLIGLTVLCPSVMPIYSGHRHKLLPRQHCEHTTFQSFLDTIRAHGSMACAPKSWTHWKQSLDMQGILAHVLDPFASKYSYWYIL